MKFILIPVLMVISTYAYSQTPESSTSHNRMDSLRIAILEQKVDEMQVNLTTGHKQYREGLHIVLGSFAGGILLALIGDAAGIEPIGFLGAGAAGVTAGSIMMIDSHKWIGRAGVKQKVAK